MSSATHCSKEYKVRHSAHEASITLAPRCKGTRRSENYEKERKTIGENMIISVGAEKACNNI